MKTKRLQQTHGSTEIQDVPFLFLWVLCYNWLHSVWHAGSYY